MSDLMKQFLEDANTAAPTSDELVELSKLAERQIELENEVKYLEDVIAKTKERLRIVQENHIPEAMAAIGMKKFTLSNGYSITVKEDVYASIRKDFFNDAISWLNDNGLGGIVKDEIAVDFGKGNHDDLIALVDYCNKQGFSATEKVSVHSQTLKATVKEQMCRGVQFPEEFFSIAPVNKAVIKK